MASGKYSERKLYRAPLRELAKCRSSWIQVATSEITSLKGSINFEDQNFGSKSFLPTCQELLDTQPEAVLLNTKIAQFEHTSTNSWQVGKNLFKMPLSEC